MSLRNALKQSLAAFMQKRQADLFARALNAKTKQHIRVVVIVIKRHVVRV